MKKISYVIGILMLAPLSYFLYYTISPLFINIKVNDSIPELVKATSTTSASVPIIGTTAHPASGTVRIIESEGKRYVRYENFKTINGPDIFVYLSKDLKASDFVNLGRVKGTEGNINYDIPEGINIKDYPYVIIWCEAFSVLFNSAKVF
jgi:hypothetical protein